jgi:hypothetical protein
MLAKSFQGGPLHDFEKWQAKYIPSGYPKNPSNESSEVFGYIPLDIGETDSSEFLLVPGSASSCALS